MDDLKRDTIETSRAGFKMAMEISAYSLLAVCQRGPRSLGRRRGDRHDDLLRRREVRCRATT